jgi:hypothetical protein
MDKFEQTLKELGIKDAASLKIEKCLTSEADAEKNGLLYRAVNEEYLLPIVEEKNPGECIHITGEMRALADRSHRMVCRKMLEKYNDRFKMVCSLSVMQKNGDRTESARFCRTIGTDILKWIQEDWKDPNLKWTDYIDIFDLLGDAEVGLYSLREPEKIHYSVFADEYVLLQASHPLGVHAKEVWLLRSRLLFEMLMERAKKIISHAKALPPSIFKELTLSVSNSTALHILFLLDERKKLTKEELREQIEDGAPFEDSYRNLKAAGFIGEARDSSFVTEEGKEYLKLFS